MNHFWLLLLPFVVAFLVYQAYRMGIAKAEEIAAHEYVERVNIWHAELTHLRDTSTKLHADFAALVAEYNAHINQCTNTAGAENE